jgi:hypothetical protein
VAVAKRVSIIVGSFKLLSHQPFMEDVDNRWLFEPILEADHIPAIENDMADYFDNSWLFDAPDIASNAIPPRIRKTTQKPVVFGPKKKRGRKSIEEEFPDIPILMTQMLHNNGFEAQRSRAVPTGQSGMSLTQIRDGLRNNRADIRARHPNLGK